MSNAFLSYFFTLLLLNSNLATTAQTVPEGSTLLKKEEVTSLFIDSIKKELRITYPIHCVYSYKSKNKLHYMVLAEKAYKSDEKESKFDSIQIVDVIDVNNQLIKNISLIDYKISHTNDALQPEFSIWFWTRYFNISDLDGDGMTDIIMVYGTTGSEGKSDGRIKIVIYYKNKKYVISHKNSGQDYDRKTYVQIGFYNLPKKIQLKATSIMKKIMQDNNGIFPAGWENGMRLKKTFLYEKFD